MVRFIQKAIVAMALALTPAMPSFAQNVEAEAPAALRGQGQAIIDGQFKAFRSRDHQQAFGYAAPTLQQVFGSTDRFIGMVKNGYGAIYDAKQWKFGRSRMKDGDLYQEVFVSGPNGKEWKALYTLRKQADGSWKIGGVRLIPAGTLGT
ncbi:DUF4864 domain-containing protein [Pseudahrensia aquimaris]|uniref:DUF4864 domain-containing protein n=1 Tax=Pseudahrensia aquimaris TaxID=744461 RepID=A0ABW3FK71_9HYPH